MCLPILVLSKKLMQEHVFFDHISEEIMYMGGTVNSYIYFLINQH
jgi:hypothetical protein